MFLFFHKKLSLHQIMSKKKEKLHLLLLSDIESSDDQRVLDGLNKIKAEGTIQLLPHLFKLWFNSSEEVELGVTEVLYSLKDEDAIPIIMDTLEKTKDGNQRQKLTSIFWNAGFEPKEFLSILVKNATEGEFMEAFECLTVIENMEPPFPEDQLMDGLVILKDYFSKKPSGEKVDLIRSIATIIQYQDDTQNDF